MKAKNILPYKSIPTTGPNFIELLMQRTQLKNSLISKNEQDTSHKLYLWHGSLAGNLILVSVNVLCLATYFLKQPYEIGPCAS